MNNYCSLSIIFVCTKGGHLTEMLQLSSLFPRYNSLLVTDDDINTSNINVTIPVKYIACFMGKNVNKLMTFLYFFQSLVQCVWICMKHKPKVIVTTGSNTAVPMCIVGKLFCAKIIYIESGARVYTQSRSGKIISKFADKIIVQWPEMFKFYPSAEYWGQIL